MKKRPLIGQVLLQKGYLNEAELKQCLSQAKLFRKRLGQIAIELGFVSDEQLTEALSEHTGIPVVPLHNASIPADILRLIPHKYCHKHRLIPYKKEGQFLFVAINDPLDIQALEDLAFMLNSSITPTLCTSAEIDHLLSLQNQGLATDFSTLQSLTADIKQDLSDQASTLPLENLERMANDAPIIKLVDLIIMQAVQKKASDIHIEKYEGALIIRYRIDGVLYDIDAPPAEFYPLIMSRIKLMAGMNIAERRLPQDGRISFKTESQGGENIDLRVSTLPSINGEGIVLRILDKTQKRLDIHELGLQGENLDSFLKLIHKPHGIILLTGPTGSGKTTALYAALSQLSAPEKKIITLEDPVEYQLERINQLNVNPQIGFTFATGLRHILRQDPDIMMVGEIRDGETAEVAMRSALTGHLVFSTLHTNDSVGAITRLINMNIEPYLVTSTIISILAQRLVRTICPKCKMVRPCTPDERTSLKRLHLSFFEPLTLTEGRGCALCYGSGYQGRTGIFELLILNEHLKELILKGTSAGLLREEARKQGMRTLREDGLEKVKQGLTTITEVLRVTQDEDEA